MLNSERLERLKKHIAANPYDGGALARCILVHASVGRHDEAAELFGRIGPFFKDTSIWRMLSDAAGNRIQIAEHEGLFFVGEHQQFLYELLGSAARYACEQLGAGLPCIVVEVGTGGSSFSLHEIDGVCLVKLAASPDDMARAAVHEFAHCVIRSNHRFFDEGLATLMEYRMDAGNAMPDRAALSRSLRHLVADRGLDRPCLEGASDYAAAARVVDWMWSQFGIESLKDWFSAVKEMDDAALVLSFEAHCGKSIESVEAELFAPFRQIEGDLDHAVIHTAFLLGDAGAVGDRLPELRTVYAIQQDTQSLESLIKALLLQADHDPSVSMEMESLVNTYLAHNADSEAADIFLFVREAQRIRRAPNFLAMHDHLASADRMLENLLERHPCSVGVLLSAAKFQLSVPVEYGGGIDSARAYLNRALALEMDDEIAGVVNRKIAQYEDGACEPAA